MPGAFMGKFAFRSTTGGTNEYLAVATVGDALVASLSSPAESDWIAYDAGTGPSDQQLLILATLEPTPLYLYVDTQLGWTKATENLFGATPFSVAKSDSPPQVFLEDGTVEGSYSLSENFPVLIFSSSVSGVALQQTIITPSLASLVANHSAKGCDFSGADLSGASFENLDCTGAVFDNCILDGTVFTGATLTGASFIGCNLQNVIWGDNPQAGGADFTGAIGRGVVFTSNPAGKTFQQANFAGATFTASDFSGASFANATLDAAFVYGANFSGANLAGANLTSLNGGLSGGNFGFDLSWAYLADANLSEAHLQGANLSHAQIYYIQTGTMSSATLIDTNLAHADLTGMNLESSTIAGANFTDTILVDCNLGGCTIEASAEGVPTCFSGAHLEGAQFTGSSFSAVHLAGAYVADANGIPLFTTPMQDGYAAKFDGGTLPEGFVTLFAGFGYALATAPVIAAGSASGQWTLTQQPVETALGVEITQFSLIGTTTTLSVYATEFSLNEMAGSIAVNINPLPVSATILTAAMLDATTRCPNGAMMQTNSALDLTWEQMLTATRQPILGTASA